MSAYTIDEQARIEMLRLVVGESKLAQLSEDALFLFYMVGRVDRCLLYSPGRCFLAARDGSKWELVIRSHVDELRASYLIAPLSQFGYASKIGWRESMGAVGEQFDVYLCTQ